MFTCVPPILSIQNGAKPMDFLKQSLGPLINMEQLPLGDGGEKRYVMKRSSAEQSVLRETFLQMCLGGGICHKKETGNRSQRKLLEHKPSYSVRELVCWSWPC